MPDATPSATPPATPVPRPRWHRRWSAPLRVLPDFLLIGAQKSGTSELDRRLTLNPRILPRDTKECRVLAGPRPSRLACRAHQETRARRTRRQRTSPGAHRAGDACPYYLFHPRVPRVARNLLGSDLDLIVLLRDPATRAWSHHRHEVRMGIETLDFEDAIDAEPRRLAGEEKRLARDPRATSGPHEHFSYLARGRYAEQLERWFEVFGRDRCLVLFAEEFFEDPAAATRRAEEHLRLQPAPPPATAAVTNRGDGSIPTADTMRRLRERFGPENDRLAALLGRPLPWPES